MLQSLLLGTTGGVYKIAHDGSARLVALQGQVITHLSASASGAAAAAVPVLGPVHTMYTSHEQPGPQDSGLHLLRRADGGDEAAPAAAERVWKGDARSCCAWDQPDGGLGLAVGTEPADVFCSLDGGRTFSEGTDGFAAAPSRAQWKFPAPPHQPHVLSIEPLPVAAGSGGADPGAGQVQLVAGIEVGGVLVSRDAGGGGPWEERSKGLFTDVHSCRIDPHDPSRWLTVTGRGLYVTRDAGASWQQQAPGTWAGRYTVGLAFNKECRGEVLVAAGDRPPAVGVHLYRSTDGGDSWEDITEAVFGSPECAEARGSCTPVPYFAGGQALVGTDTGHLLGAEGGDRRRWRPMCRLPHPITCVAAPGQSPSSIMH